MWLTRENEGEQTHILSQATKHKQEGLRPAVWIVVFPPRVHFLFLSMRGANPGDSQSLWFEWAEWLQLRGRGEASAHETTPTSWPQ